MTAHRLDGFSFNRANIAGLDAMERAGVSRYLTAREREINTINTETLTCSGGPFDGQPMELTTRESGGGSTAVMTVGNWIGHYEHTCKEVDGKKYTCAAWIGNGQKVDAIGYMATPQAKAIKAVKPLGKGFDKLGELLASMAQPATVIQHAGQSMAVFKIARLTYRVINTPESIDALRAKILKAKKWFTDAMLAKNGTPKALPIAAEIDTAAAASVATVLATAQALADMAQATAAPAAELATVCASADSASAGNTPTVGRVLTNTAQGSSSTPGQAITSKSGNWSARSYRGNDGAVWLEFTGPDGNTHTSSYTNGSARMQALQSLAKMADQAPAPARIDIDGLDINTLSAADVQAWTNETFKQVLAQHEEINLHTECVILEALRAGSDDLAAQAKAILTQQVKAGYLTEELNTRLWAVRHSIADLPSTISPTKATSFEKAAPVAIDLRLLINQGLPLADLVGLGVDYSGDMANPSGRGAIVSADLCKWNGLVLCIDLEDGRRLSQISAVEFSPQIRTRYKLNMQRHGAPYLAQLAAARAAIKASESSKQQLAKQKYDRDLVALAAQFPQLTRAQSKHQGGKLAAVNIRILLKAAFKGVKFSVTSDYNSVRVSWVDGPALAAVDKLIEQFDTGASDLQTDYFYNVSTAFSDLFGGVQYLTTNRQLSDQAVNQLIAQVWPNPANRPTLEDYRHGKTRDGSGSCRVYLASKNWTA